MLALAAAFAIVVWLLPDEPAKGWLWVMVGILFLTSAAQIDWAHRRLRKLLPELTVSELAIKAGQTTSDTGSIATKEN